MRDYNSWHTPISSNSEEIVFDKCEKIEIKINGLINIYDCIINDANEWQKDIDIIILIKKSVYNSLKFGDFITLINNNKNYIVYFDIEDRDFYISAKCRLCTHTLNVIKNTVLLPIPCIVSNSTTVETVEGTKFFPLIEGKIEVTVPNNENTQSIDVNQVYQIGRNKYKIYHINDTGKPGLLILSMEFTNENVETPLPSPTSDLTITGEDNIVSDTSAIYQSNMPCTWLVMNVDNSVNEYVTIIEQNNTYIKLFANDYVGKYIKLSATSTADETITTEKTIQIVGLF